MNRPTLRTLLLAGWATGTVACLDGTPPPQAPQGLDENLAWFWTNSDALKDEEVVAGAKTLAAAAKADSWAKPTKAQSKVRLTKEEVGVVVPSVSQDPAAARGLLAVTMFDCTTAKLEGILAADDQFTLFPGVWDANVRTKTSDGAAFLSGAANTVSWSSAIKITFPIGDQYSSTIRGSLRRVPVADKSFSQSGLIVARTWLPSPAVFGQGSTSYFKQDYQIEIFWEPTAGRIFHAYGMWREVKVGGFNLTLEDNGFMNLVLDNMVTWDDKVTELCKKP